ncbi:MAG: DUF5672 family protein [Pseudomonadota bacterium]|nr:DUF5672 family protein [Pseudomonadota bacterium]
MPAEILSHPASGKTAASRLALPEVTLVAITSVAVGPTLEAVKRCIDQIDFGRVLFLSDIEPPAELTGTIEWRKIPALRSRRQYSEFMLRHLHRHVETSHALCVQWDGFVIDPSRWSPDFLDFDFIGAPWPQFKDSHVVGNGGFSLRSLQLMQACAELNYDESEPEDTWICRTARPELEARYAMRFASPLVAKRFAFERTPATGEEFGFHGVFNMGEVIGARRLARILKQLEPELIARNELWDLLRWALKRGQVHLSWQVARRLFGST